MRAKVLVVYASRHGATRGIAERIAARLTESGVDVTLEGAQEVEDVGGFDAYRDRQCRLMFHWLKDATDFVRHHRRLLAGPARMAVQQRTNRNRDEVDKTGRDVREASVPPEIRGVPKRRSIHAAPGLLWRLRPDAGADRPRGTHRRRVPKRMPAARDAFPPATSATGTPSTPGPARSPASSPPSFPPPDSDHPRRAPLAAVPSGG